MSLLDCDLSNGARHARDCNFDDAFREMADVGAADAFSQHADGANGALAMDLNVAAEAPGRVHPVQGNVGIRHRRLDAAMAVACRTGQRTGAARPDAKNVSCLQARQTAAAGSDGIDADLMSLDRIAR